MARLISFRMAGLMSRLLARFIPFGTAGIMSRYLVGLVRETLQAYANADPANSREDEINAEEKPKNVEASHWPVRKDDQAKQERDHA